MKVGFLLTALIFLSYITMASPLTEFSFKEQGYQDFYINGFGEYDCKKYNFVLNQDLNSAVFPVFSLNAEFSPQIESDASIIVFFNDDNSIAELKSTDFENNIARIWIPREKVSENNNIKVCGKTSFSVNRILVSADSEFGVYYAPFFPKEDGFKLELETYQPIVGIPFRIDAVAKNYGSEDSEVSLSYRREELEEYLEEITILGGETSKNGTAPKCLERNASADCIVPGEYRISYSAVANKAVPMTLLPAQLGFLNTFGETKNIQSDRPSIEAFEPKHSISAQIFVAKDNPLIGEAIPLKVKIKNIGKTRINNVSVDLRTGLEIIGEVTKTIAFLNADQSTELSFTAKGINQGEYSLGCMVTYNSKSLECSQTSVLLDSEELSGEILIGIGFVLVALAVFGYFYFKRD
tara:strand:+ start:5213 stop:6439 length:1227 start_codon:yes stop_codon:yes gene_type:complete